MPDKTLYRPPTARPESLVRLGWFTAGAVYATTLLVCLWIIAHLLRIPWP